MAATKNQLESLKEALSYDHAPLCSGAISPPPEGFHLYYGKHNPKFVDLGSATSEEIEQLSAACDPATFGRGNEDVYDESYRRAVKMDASNFAVQFDPIRTGLIETIEDQLLRTQKKEMSIDAEIYKLNVYGKDSFFKAHQDTPRGADMLGSLVIVFPTPHKGGELVLRHKDREWSFDANALISLRSPHSLAYVAFYSDIEHEVLKVTSGHRVTLTYNLYSKPSGPKPNTTPAAITSDPNASDSFQTTLRGLLKSPEFLPDGGTLGFGLVHLYPVTFNTKLGGLTQYLKGEDAHIYRTCQELQLKPVLRMIYDDCEKPRERGVMVNKIIEQPQYDYEYGVTYASHLVEKLGGVAVNKVNSTSAKPVERYFEGDGAIGEARQITWISPFNKANQLRDFAMAYGNEVSVGYIYCSPCLIAHVAPANERT